MDSASIAIITAIIKGFVVGFFIAIPVGPVAILIIRRTLARGLSYGILSGLGAATADYLYALIACFGVGYITQLLVTNRLWIQLLGGIFLVGLGMTIFFGTMRNKQDASAEYGPFATYTSTLLLTLTNPITLLSFITAFSSIEMASILSYALLALGVFLGSLTWFSIVSYSASLFHTQLEGRTLRRINRISGALLASFGIGILLMVIFQR